ncbi:BrnA antitoxin family protein [Desulfobacterales bacterium HSG2]|nr:BrnA antitoxin family protein [Desulfobacterales bacterium HSG2]
MKKKSYTDWAYFDSLTDDEIDILPTTEEDLARAVLRMPRSPKVRVPVTVSLDIEVLTWFKSQSKDYQVNINNVLRIYMETRKTSVSECK